MVKATAPSGTLDVIAVRDRLGEIVERVRRGGDGIVIESNGERAAAIVSADDFDRLRALNARRDEQKQAIAEFSRAFADVPLEELEQRVADAVMEARAQLRAERALADRQ